MKVPGTYKQKVTRPLEADQWGRGYSKGHEDAKNAAFAAVGELYPQQGYEEFLLLFWKKAAEMYDIEMDDIRTT